MATASNPSDCETGTDKSPLLGTRVDETAGGGSRRVNSVEDATTDHVEERGIDWGSSKAFLVYWFLFYLAFLIPAIVILFLSREEHPSMPLRLWILLYTLPCVLHMVHPSVQYRMGLTGIPCYLLITAHVSALIWWIVGVCWVCADGQAIHDSPLLYWLCVAFLGFDLFFVVLRLALPVLPIVLISCCAPSVIEMLKWLADRVH